MRRLLTLAFLLLASPVFAQTGGGAGTGSTKAAQEFAKALTAATRFGVPRYTTVALPTCNAANTGAVAFNTTSGSLTTCNGSAWLVGGGAAASITPGTTTVGSSTNCFAFADGSSVLQCGSSFVADNSGAGNGVLTVAKTMSGASATSNFLNVTGTFPTTLTNSAVGTYLNYTGAGSSAQAVFPLLVSLGAGFTGAGGTFGVYSTNVSAGTQAGSGHYAEGGNFGGLFKATGTGSVVNNTGVAGYATGASTTNVGVAGVATSSTGTPTNNVGGIFYAANGGTVSVGVAGVLNAGVATSVLRSAAGYFNNGAVEVPIITAMDNSAALPTTGATATWTVLNGAWTQQGNGVLTSATMTAETQARESGSMIHSYTWTNAQVVALGATTAGDISVATLPAKTVVKNAYVVITGTAAGVTTLTVACGRTSATYIDYIVASDAKAAANTVYGDASAERGTNLTGYDLPSYTGTTAVNCHFISTGANLSAVTGSTGRVILETSLVP